LIKSVIYEYNVKTSKLAIDFSCVKIMIADFSQIRELISADDKIDIIYSSYALHHLNPKDKRNVIKQAISILIVD
jgi:hypothetical protein